MASEFANSMKIWVSHIDSWVAQQEERNRKRKVIINDAKADPKAARAALEAQLVEFGEVERGMQRVQDALKNAQPALDKLRSQAKKDEQMLLALLAGGGAAESLTSKTPFVKTMVASVDPIADKAKQAFIDVKTLMEQIQRDAALTQALDGGRSDVDSILKLLRAAAEQLDHTRSSSQLIESSLLSRLD
jgi:hypothetical protein